MHCSRAAPQRLSWWVTRCSSTNEKSWSTWSWKNRLPAIYREREYAEAGGLIAYGPSVPDNFRRAAGYVARILRGEKPGDLPVVQPAKFELVILDVPWFRQQRADEVIE